MKVQKSQEQICRAEPADEATEETAVSFAETEAVDQHQPAPTANVPWLELTAPDGSPTPPPELCAGSCEMEPEQIVVQRPRWRPGPEISSLQRGDAELLRGHHGASIYALQTMLNAAGAEPPLRVDGFFGPRTEGALLRFQSAHQGSGHPGVAGRALWSALEHETERRLLRSAFLPAQLGLVAREARPALLKLLAVAREPWKRAAIATLVESSAFTATSGATQAHILESIKNHQGAIAVIEQHRQILQQIEPLERYALRS